MLVTKKTFSTPGVKKITEVYPHAVIFGDHLFLSGMPGIDPVSGNIISNDFEGQARQSFLNIKIILEAAGSNMSKIVKTTIFMVHGNDFSIVNKIYSEFFPQNAPARSTPQVMPFPGGILISVECIALL